jgi:uncharacterized Zn finger protein
MFGTSNNLDADLVNNEARQWWVERWLELLNSYRYKKRLERARMYAREGNVLNIEFQEARVIATVQGSETEPYLISLFLDAFSDEDWEYIVNTLSQKAIFSAQLLAGEMPEDIDRVFISNGLNLFPYTLADIHSDCSCPDPANPCKHIGAVYYQLADRFSEDPFVLFQLRGRNKNQILDALRQLRKQNLQEQEIDKLAGETKTKNNKKTKKKAPSTTLEQLSNDLTKFWQYEESLEPSLVTPTSPIDNKTTIDLLGRIPLPIEEATALQQYLVQVYQATGKIEIVGEPRQSVN